MGRGYSWAMGGSPMGRAYGVLQVVPMGMVGCIKAILVIVV